MLGLNYYRYGKTATNNDNPDGTDSQGKDNGGKALCYAAVRSLPEQDDGTREDRNGDTVGKPLGNRLRQPGQFTQAGI